MNLPIWFMRKYGGAPAGLTVEEYLSELQYAVICAASSWTKSGGANFMTYAVRGMFFARKQFWSSRRLDHLNRTVSLDVMLDSDRRPPGLRPDWKKNPLECVHDFPVDREDELEFMRKNLSIMTPKQAKVTKMWLAGMSLRKIAKRCQMTHQNASGLFLRGIEQVREHMGIYENVAV